MVKETLQQSQVNEHFELAKPEDKPKFYTDEIFKEAVIQWLIKTNQVCPHLLSEQRYLPSI